MNITSEKHAWLYLGAFFALISSFVGIGVWLFFPERIDLVRILFPTFIAACVGAGIGARSSTLSTEPSETTRTQYREKAIQQSKFQRDILKAPIVWVAIFSVIGFTAIYCAT